MLHERDGYWLVMCSGHCLPGLSCGGAVAGMICKHAREVVRAGADLLSVRVAAESAHERSRE